MSKNRVTYGTVWSLAGPNIISNILFVSVSTAHLAIVSPLGTDASAALVAGSRLQFLLMSVAMALSVATTALVSRAWGAEDKEAVSRITSASVSFALFLSVLFGVLVYASAENVAAMFGLADEAKRQAVDLVHLVAVINPIFALVLVYSMALRAIGDVSRPMWVTGIANALAIPLSYWFVQGGFGLQSQGVAGVMLAWALCQFGALLFFTYDWFAGRHTLRVRGDSWLSWDLHYELLRLGLPAAMEQALLQASFLIFMMLIADYGTEAFASYGIGITILSVCIVVGLGFGTASATLTGQSLGANDIAGARASGWATMRLAAVSMALLAVVSIAMRDPLAAVMASDPLTRSLTASFIIILAVVQPMMGVEFALGGALRGAGDTRFPLFSTMMGNIVARFSLGAAIIVLEYSIYAMFAVLIGDYLVKATLLIIRFRGVKWLEVAQRHEAPSAIPSLAGFSRAAMRVFYRKEGRKRRSSQDNKLL